MRRVVAILASALLTASFLVGPFVHVHADADHLDAHHEGAVVHAHLPAPPAGDEPEHPAAAGDGHAGESIDLFLLRVEKGLQTVELSAAPIDLALAPAPSFAGELTPERRTRARDPALSVLPPRAPPA